MIEAPLLRCRTNFSTTYCLNDDSLSHFPLFNNYFQKRHLGLDVERKQVNQDEISDNIFDQIHPGVEFKLSDLLKDPKGIFKLQKSLLGGEIPNKTKVFRNFLKSHTQKRYNLNRQSKYQSSPLSFMQTQSMFNKNPQVSELKISK